MSCSLSKHMIMMPKYFAKYSFRKINEPKLHCYILKKTNMTFETQWKEYSTTMIRHWNLFFFAGVDLTIPGKCQYFHSSIPEKALWTWKTPWKFCSCMHILSICSDVPWTDRCVVFVYTVAYMWSRYQLATVQLLYMAGRVLPSCWFSV